MENIIVLFGYLLLTFLGFVVPVFIVLIPLYGVGVKRLSKDYIKESEQKSEQIEKQNEKIKKDGTEGVGEIEEIIKELRVSKGQLDKKIWYLDPNKQILNLFIPILVSFILVLLALFLENFYKDVFWYIIPLGFSILLFFYVIYSLWEVFNVVIEMKEVANEKLAEKEQGVLNILGKILDNLNRVDLLEDVHTSLDGEKLGVGISEIIIASDRKKEMVFRIINSEQTKVVKNVEVGFIFPADDFIIEKTTNQDISITDDKQIVRYKDSLIQSKTSLKLSNLILTPLKIGEQLIDVFIKGENVKTRYFKIKFKVVE